MMQEEEHVFDDRPLTEDRVAEMKSIANELLHDLSVKPDPPAE